LYLDLKLDKDVADRQWLDTNEIKGCYKYYSIEMLVVTWV